MAFFGLTEYQEESQYLFEKTFGLKFLTPFTQLAEDETPERTMLPKLNSSVFSQIKRFIELARQRALFVRQELVFKAFSSL